MHHCASQAPPTPFCCRTSRPSQEFRRTLHIMLFICAASMGAHVRRQLSGSGALCHRMRSRIRCGSASRIFLCALHSSVVAQTVSVLSRRLRVCVCVDVLALSGVMRCACTCACQMEVRPLRPPKRSGGVCHLSASARCQRWLAGWLVSKLSMGIRAGDAETSKLLSVPA